MHNLLVPREEEKRDRRRKQSKTLSKTLASHSGGVQDTSQEHTVGCPPQPVTQ